MCHNVSRHNVYVGNCLYATAGQAAVDSPGLPNHLCWSVGSALALVVTNSLGSPRSWHTYGCTCDRDTILQWHSSERLYWVLLDAAGSIAAKSFSMHRHTSVQWCPAHMLTAGLCDKVPDVPEDGNRHTDTRHKRENAARSLSMHKTHNQAVPSNR